MNKNIYVAYPDQSKKGLESVANTIQPPVNSMPETNELSCESASPEKGTIRITLDLPKNLHKAMKRLVVEDSTTLRAYVINLMEADLKGRGIKH